MSDIRMTDSEVRRLEEVFSLKREAVDVLDLIVSEFNSDPMSVQCFDSAIVDRAKTVIARLQKSDMFFRGF